MKNCQGFRSFVLFACFVLLAFAGQAFADSPTEPFEGAPAFLARDLIGPEYCLGEHHKVLPIVSLDDFEYVFHIESEHGDYQVYGIEAVIACIREIEAIAYLNELTQSEAFASSLGNSLKEPINVTFGIARRPVSTVAGLPSGVSRYLQGKFYQVKRTSGNAFKRMRGSKKEAENTVDAETPEGAKEKSKTVKSARKLSRRHLGYDSSKRSLAKQLGVDPYSDNENLQEALGRIAWASSFGGVAGSFAIPASDVVSYAGKAQSVVWEKPPVLLERDNIRALKKMHVSKERIQRFTDSLSLSLSEKTAIVLALSEIANTESSERILELAMSVKTKRDASTIVRTLRILQTYSEGTSKIVRIVIVDGMYLAYAENGYLVLPLAADYLHWTELIAGALAGEDFDVEKREVWLSGKASSLAKGMLESRDWHLVEHSLEPSSRNIQ